MGGTIFICIYFGGGKVLIHHTFPKTHVKARNEQSVPHFSYQHSCYAWVTCGSVTQARIVRELGLEPSFPYKQPENGGRGWFSSCEETKGLQEQILSG